MYLLSATPDTGGKSLTAKAVNQREAAQHIKAMREHARKTRQSYWLTVVEQTEFTHESFKILYV